MKVLLINSVCGVGSTGKICAELAEILISEGHTVKIAYGRGNLPEKYKHLAYKISNDKTVKAHALLSRVFDSSGLHSKTATRRFIKWIEDFNPDVIHLHNLHGYYLNYRILFDYLKKSNKKIVWTLHDCWAITGHCAHFDYIGCNRFIDGCFNCPQKKNYPKSNIFSKSKRNYKLKKDAFTGVKNLTVVTPSKWLSGVVKQSFLGSYPVKVINNGIDLSVFNPTKSDFKKTYNLEYKFVILGVAFSWGKKKGLDIFKKLADELSSDYKIVLIGVSDAVKKDLPKNIIAISKTQNQEGLAKIYSSADLFVNPTREETLGLVNAEALACGTPVLTFNTGGSPETIDSTCGSVVDRDDINSLISEIERIKNEKPFTKGNCVKRAKSFDKNENCKEYIKLMLEQV